MNLSKISDVLIVGGGVIGLAIARQLHKKGARKITVLERGAVGREASYAAAGMLAPQAETEEINDFFHLCNESNKLYPSIADELFDETGIDIELDQSGTLYLAFTDGDVKNIRHRFAWQKKAGLEIEYLSAEAVRKLEPFASPDVREALFFPNDWQVENRKLLAALEKYARTNQIEIVENLNVKNLLIEDGKVVGVETTNQNFSASTFVLATGAWTSLIKAGGLLLPVITPIRGQILSFKTAKRLFKRVIYSPRGYLVPRIDGRILAGATVESVGFDKNVTASGIDFLHENALEIAPSLVNLERYETWANLRPFASDGFPVLGAFPEAENLYIATAHYRNGILLAPVTAEILADKILENRDSKYLKIYSPRRFQKAKAF